jgi:hypothetical protein
MRGNYLALDLTGSLDPVIQTVQRPLQPLDVAVAQVCEIVGHDRRDELRVGVGLVERTGYEGKLAQRPQLGTCGEQVTGAAEPLLLEARQGVKPEFPRRFRLVTE